MCELVRGQTGWPCWVCSINSVTEGLFCPILTTLNPVFVRARHCATVRAVRMVFELASFHDDKKKASDISRTKCKGPFLNFFIWKFSGLRKIEFNLLKWQISIRYKLSHISWLTMNDNLWIIILCNRNWFGNTRDIRFSGFSDDFVDYFLPLKRFKSMTHLYESLHFDLVCIFWPATWLRNWPLNFFEFVFHEATARTIELTQSLKTRLIMTQFRWLITYDS